MLWHLMRRGPPLELPRCPTRSEGVCIQVQNAERNRSSSHVIMHFSLSTAIGLHNPPHHVVTDRERRPKQRIVPGSGLQRLDKSISQDVTPPFLTSFALAVVGMTTLIYRLCRGACVPSARVGGRVRGVSVVRRRRLKGGPSRSFLRSFTSCSRHDSVVLYVPAWCDTECVEKAVGESSLT